MLSKRSKPDVPCTHPVIQAHNIDNVCIEALSVELDERALEKATRYGTCED